MTPTHSNFLWFTNNIDVENIFYKNGEILAQTNTDGTGKWFYANGDVALECTKSKDCLAEFHYIIYACSTTKPYLPVSNSTCVLAYFDMIGNGVVYDEHGTVRAKYNQNEGKLLDCILGPRTYWKWHSLCKDYVLEELYSEVRLTKKDSFILSFGEKDFKSISKIGKKSAPNPVAESNMLLVEQTKLLGNVKYIPFKIKFMTIKINDQFTLKIMDQTNIKLTFRNADANLSMNLGMNLNPDELLDSNLEEIGEVSCPILRFPSKSSSIMKLQKKINDSKRQYQTFQKRNYRIKRPIRTQSHVGSIKCGYRT